MWNNSGEGTLSRLYTKVIRSVMPSQGINGCSIEARHEKSTTENVKCSHGGDMMHFKTPRRM